MQLTCGSWFPAPSITRWNNAQAMIKTNSIYHKLKWCTGIDLKKIRKSCGRACCLIALSHRFSVIVGKCELILTDICNHPVVTVILTEEYNNHLGQNESYTKYESIKQE